MKKLVIAAFAVAFAAVTQAATFSWEMTTSHGKGIYDGTGTDTAVSGTVYLFFVSIYSQSDLIDSFVTNNGSSIDTSKAVGSTTLYGGLFSANTVKNVNVTSDDTAYMAVLNGNRLFISDTTTASYNIYGGTGEVCFSSQNTLSNYNNTTATLLPANDATAGFTSAGWYAIPEPTSGLLLLVGTALLALKRRRA